MSLGFANILITGGAGFVGSNLALFLKRNYPSVNVFALDNLKRRGSELNLPRLAAGGVGFYHGDIRCVEDLDMLPAFDLMIECSAEPSVLAGYDAPGYMINTNLTGAVNCLELCRKRGAAFFFISTSRVYSIDALCAVRLDETPSRLTPSACQTLPGVGPGGITEEFPVAGQKSLYGAAKYCAEVLAEEYRAFGVESVVNRCSILAGPWQMGKADQGVMTYWMLRHHFGMPLRYIGFGGSGKQLRDLLDIDDYCELVALELANFHKVKGRTLNVGGGPDHAFSLVELTQACAMIAGKRVEVTADPEQRKGDIPYYVTDSGLISSILGWKPKIAALETLERIHRWIGENEADARRIL